jgi:hypothetical protein
MATMHFRDRPILRGNSVLTEHLWGLADVDLAMFCPSCCQFSKQEYWLTEDCRAHVTRTSQPDASAPKVAEEAYEARLTAVRRLRVNR